MQAGIFAKTFPGNTPDAVLTLARDAGFSAVQYNMACSGLAAMPDEIAMEQASAVALAAKRTGISVAALSGTFNMIHPDSHVVADGLRRLEVMASRCQAMGTALITLCTGTRDPLDQWRHHPDNSSMGAWLDLCRTMAKALAIAERHDVSLGVEPELANVVNSAERAAALLAEMKSSRLRIVLDAANLFDLDSLAGQRRIVSAAIARLAGSIALAHAKDRDAGGAFVTAGKGVLDYRHYVSELGRAGFSGPLVTHGLTAQEAPAVADFLSSILADCGYG